MDSRENNIKIEGLTFTVPVLAIIEEGFIQKIRQGKGRRCSLGDRISSIPCRASYLTPERFKE